MSTIPNIITYEFRIYSPGSITNYLKIIFSPNEDYTGGYVNANQNGPPTGTSVSSEDIRQAVFSSFDNGQTTEEQEFNEDFRNSFKLMLLDSGPYMSSFGPVSFYVTKTYESDFDPVDIYSPENMLLPKVYKIDYNEPKTLQQLKEALLSGDIFGQGLESSEGYGQSPFPWFLDVSITGDPTAPAPYKDDEITFAEALVGVEQHGAVINISPRSSGADEVIQDTVPEIPEEAEALVEIPSWSYKPKDHCLADIDDISDPDGESSLFAEIQPEVCDTSLDPDPEDVILSMGEYMRVCPTCIPNDSFSKSWRDYNIQVVWLDEFTCEYVISFYLNTSGLTWNNLQLEENLESAKRFKNRAIYLGLQKILRERGKIVSDDIILAAPSQYSGNSYELGIDIDYGDPNDPILNAVIKRSIDSGQNDGTTVSIYGLHESAFDLATIEKPLALQLYSKCSMEKATQGGTSDYLEYPDSQPYHVVRVPAALINSIPDDPLIHASEENNEVNSVLPSPQEGITETVIRGIEARQILKSDFAKLFKTFGEYQAHFLHIQNGRVRIFYPEDEDGNTDEATMPFYLGKYQFKFENFYTDLKALLDNNGFRLTRKDSGYKHAYEIKIVVENMPSKKYVIKKVFARYFNCPYKRLTRGVETFIDSWRNEQTLVSYVIKHKQELSYIGNNIPPWQNFISDFTYPEVFYNYGNPSQGLDASSCLANTTNSPDEEGLLEDLLLSSALSFSSALEYSMNTLNCRKIEDYDITSYQEMFEQFNPSNNPEVMKQLTDYKKYGQALTTQYNEARPYLAKKSKTAFAKILKNKKEPEKMFFERLMGEPIGQFVRNAGKDPEEKIGKLMSKINPCNWEKILLDLIRCMMKGLNANTVLRKTAASLMGNLSPIEFGRVFAGLPADVQQEVEAEITQAIAGLDYFSNYTEFDVDTYIGLAERQNNESTKQDYEKERSPVTPPPETSQADPSALQDIEETRDDYETTTNELEQLLTKQEQGMLSKTEYDRLQVEIEQAEGLIAQWQGIKDGYSDEAEAVENAQAQIDNFTTDLDNLNSEVESLFSEIDFTEEDFATEEKFEEAMGTLKTSIESKQLEKNTAAFAVLDELTKNASPNQYEKAARKILETVGKAYIDVIINKLSIDQLKELVDSLPGADIFLPIFKAQLCPHQELLETWQKAAWASLDINPCKKSSWQLPPIPNINGFKFLNILEVMLQEFIKELTKRIMAALLAYFMKALNKIVQKVCDLLAGVGGALLNDGQDGMSNGSLFDAIADSFCGDFNEDVYGGAGQFGPSGAYQSSGANTLSDTWEMYTGKQIPMDVIMDWGGAISEVVTLTGWKELFVTGTNSGSSTVAEAWLVTQDFPDITGYIRNEDELGAFFNLLSDHLTTLEATNIENTINSLGSTWSVGNDTICKIFCGDLTYGTEEFPADFPYEANTARFSRDFEDLLNSFVKGPDDDYNEAFREISDPFGNDGYCEDVMDLFQDDANAISGKRPLIGKEPEAVRELKEEIADSTFQMLEVSYYNDLISSKESFFNNLLADRGNKKLTKGDLFDPSHEFRTRFNLLWPNANNSIREHKNKWIGAGFLLKLFMRISHNRRMDEIEAAEDEEIENLEEVEEAGEDENLNLIQKVVKKIKKFVRRKLNKILSGPIRKFFAIFKIDYPEPTNILPKTVGLSFKESLATTDGMFQEDLNELHGYNANEVYRVDISELGLGTVKMYKPMVRYSLNEPFPKTPDISVRAKLGKSYESVTGYSQNQLYKSSEGKLGIQYKWLKAKEEDNGPRYVISCYEMFYGKPPDSDIEGYIEDTSTGEQIVTAIEAPNNQDQSTSNQANTVLNNVISVPIDVTRYRQLYEQYFEEKDQNNKSPQRWAFIQHINIKFIEALKRNGEDWSGSNAIQKVQANLWRLEDEKENSSSAHNWEEYYRTYATFYDRVCQDVINKMTAGLMRGGETLEAEETSQTMRKRSNSNAFNFGYDHKQQIKFNDLLYVNPEANQNPNTWYYDKEEEEQELGKSATGNNRVVFLNPNIYGGSYKRPKIYVKPASYGGIYGLFQYYVPEPDACGPTNEIKLFVQEIKDQILKLEREMTRDERMNLDVECANEPPFDLIADNSSHAYIHGTVRLTIRTYVLEFLLRCMPVIEQIRLTPENFDDSMGAFLIDNIRKGAKQTPENFSFRKFSRDEYWYLLLEQMVQTTEREILTGELSPDGTLTSMLDTLSGIRSSYKQPDREDLKFLRLIKKVGRRKFFRAESMEQNLSIGGSIQYVTFKDRFPKNWEDVSETQRNRLIFMIDALAFHSLGPLFKSKLSTTEYNYSSSKKYTKFNGYAFTLKTLKRACKVYKIYQNEQLAINISSYLVRKELERYLKTYRIDTTNREGGPAVFNVSKYALNPQSGLAWGPPIKVGLFEAEKVSGGLSNQQYGDVHDLHEDTSEKYEYDARDMYSIMSIIEDSNTFSGEGDNLHVDPTLTDRPVSFFYVEKYIVTFLKNDDFVPQAMKDLFLGWYARPMSIATFQEKIKFLTDSSINFTDGTSSISDFFGDATLNADGESYSGTIGIKFGVRLSYCRSDLELYNSVFRSNSRGKRTFVNIDGKEAEYCPLPLLEYEQDVLDISIGEYMYEKVPQQNAGEILKCYIDRMCEMEEYSFIMEYLFPVKRCSSIVLFNSYYSYINSIGEHPSERDDYIESADNEWKGRIMQKTKEKLRTMFSRYYKARDFNKERGDKRSTSVEWLKFNIPAINSNIDFASIPWWQRMRFHERPWNKYDEACIDGAMGAFNQNTSQIMVQPESDESAYTYTWTPPVYDGQYTTYEPPVCPEECIDENGNTIECPEDSSDTSETYAEGVPNTPTYPSFTSPPPPQGATSGDEGVCKPGEIYNEQTGQCEEFDADDIEEKLNEI